MPPAASCSSTRSLLLFNRQTCLPRSFVTLRLLTSRQSNKKIETSYWTQASGADWKLHKTELWPIIIGLFLIDCDDGVHICCLTLPIFLQAHIVLQLRANRSWCFAELLNTVPILTHLWFQLDSYWFPLSCVVFGFFCWRLLHTGSSLCKFQLLANSLPGASHLL